MTNKIPRLLALFFLVLFLGAPAMGKKEKCKSRASRCNAHSDCCSKACLPFEKGSPKKYCKVVSKVEQPPPGHCADHGATCLKASDCCSGLCEGKNVMFCWDMHRGLRASLGNVDEDHEA